MTLQDQQMIDGLIDRIRNTQINDRDSEAAARLQQGLGGHPDAIYILAQTVLVQQHSLEQAHAQLDQLEAQFRQAAQPSPQPVQSTSWLDRFFGSSSPQPQQSYPQQPPPYSAPPPPYQTVNVPQAPYGYQQQPYPTQSYPPQPYPPQGYGYGAPQAWGQATGMGGGSFLRNAMQTAAGVAAGEMLFHGVESMFGGRHHEGRETVVNNYYEERPSEHEHHALAGTDTSFYDPKDDASRDDADARGFADTGAFNSGSDGTNYDDSSFSEDFSSDDSN